MRMLSLLVALSGWILTFSLGAQAQASSAAKHNSAKAVYWSSRSEGIIYRWTEQDLTAIVMGKPVFSVASLLKKEFGKQDADDVLTFYEVTFWPVSVVGPFLSYERDDYWDGGAHPSGGETFVSVDTRDPKQHLKLTDLFEAASIRGALLSDPIVQHILTREKIAPPPTLEGLVKALSNKAFGGEMDGMFRFPNEFLDDFAFHHIENGKIAVRFLLPHGSEINRFHHTQLGLMLPIPARWKSAFLQASTGASGAMTPSLQKTAHGRKSSVILMDHAAPKKGG